LSAAAVATRTPPLSDADTYNVVSGLWKLGATPTTKFRQITSPNSMYLAIESTNDAHIIQKGGGLNESSHAVCRIKIPVFSADSVRQRSDGLS
jgi:hypothetical protein